MIIIQLKESSIMASCNCNHKSRKDEQKCCCDCHGKSNMKKDCSKRSVEPVREPQENEGETYEKR